MHWVLLVRCPFHQSSGTGIQRFTFPFQASRTVPAPQLRLLTHSRWNSIFNCLFLFPTVLSIDQANNWLLLSKSCYDWRSVSQYVSVSSSIWNLWPDILFCLKVAVLSLWGAHSHERPDLSPVSHCQQYLVLCKRFNIIYIVHVTCFMCMQHILYLCQHRLSTADHATTSVS
jgi:hypothetical protein